MWIFFIFRSSKIRIIATGVVSSLFPLRCCLSSGQRCHATAPCHASFPWTQDVLATPASSSGNASYRRLPFQAKTELFNPHHRRRPPSPDNPTLTLYCYKKIISILITLPTIQSYLHFPSSPARVPHYWSSTRHCCSLSPSSHAYHSSAQRHPRWRISRPSFAFWTTYRHMNSCKKIFWNLAASHRVIN
jgi:hypothetical protein